MKLIRGEDGVLRCPWGATPGDYARYHDREWGMPATADSRLFEKICLEGFQAGLSWITILRKRADFRRCFAGFDVDRVAHFNRRSVERLLRDASIVRHRGKIESAIHNARRAIEVRDEFGSLARYFWGFEPRRRACPRPIPATSEASTALSKDLKRRGFSFVGPTTVYAFMQAMGLVNDHLPGCPARARCEGARRALGRLDARRSGSSQ